MFLILLLLGLSEFKETSCDNSKRGQKLFFVGWDSLCLLKESGGLSLRLICLMIKTLLGKWLWHYGVERQFMEGDYLL